LVQTIIKNKGMKQLFLIAFSIALLSTNIFGQGTHDKFKDKFDDVFEEEESGNLTLRFFNALNGEAIPNATVSLEGLGEFTSDEEGKVRFPIPEDDGFLAVHFECPKFITSDFKVEVIAQTVFFNRFSVSPELDLKHVRIVLDWDSEPKDLDAHFWKEGGYHISYHHTRVLSDGTGGLDRDDMDGFGPETITIRDIDDLGTYTFAVMDYTNKGNGSANDLAKSKASVKVYGEGRLLHVFNVPQVSAGNKWAVFKISEGQFIEINQVMD